MNHVTVRIQKKYRDNVRMRLIVFGTLAGILVIASAFSRYLTPYDPYLQDLSNVKAGTQCASSFGHRPLWERHAFQGDSRKQSQCVFHAVAGVGDYRCGHSRGHSLWLARRFHGHFFHEDLRCFSCLSWPGVRAGGGRQLWRRTA